MSTSKTKDERPPLNPSLVICVIKHDGKEVGRVAAAAHNARAYITELSRQYESITIDHVENSTEAMIDQMLRSPRK